MVVGRSNKQCIRCIKEKPMAFIKGNNMMRTKKKSMKVAETTTSGSVGGGAPAQGLGKMHKRAGSMFKGKKTTKKFYESPQFASKQQVIDYFVRRGKTAKQGAAAWERGYRGTKKATPPSHWLDRAEKAQQDREDQKAVSEQTNKKVPKVYQPFVPAVGKRLEFHDPNTGLLMSSATITNIDNDLIYFKDDETDFEYMVPKKEFDPQTLHEREINEQDLIIIPGQGHRLKPGLLPKHNRTDHEVEMAKSDLFQAAKNATEIYKIIRDVPETQGLEGWVQEKIIKANDYLNSVREYLQHRDFDQKMPIDEEASIRQKLKTMLRNMDPTILDRVGSEGIDKVQYGWDLEDQKNLSPEDAKLASKNIRHGNRLRRLAHGENPFTGQPKQMKEMTGGVLAGGMSNFEEGVAEGSEDTQPEEGTVRARIMRFAPTPTVQVQVFKHNTLRGDSYWVDKEARQFKTMDQARAYVDRVNKQGVAEGAPELLKKEMPTHRHAEKLLAQNGVSKDDPDYHHHLGNTIKHLRQFGNIDLINKSDKQGVAEGTDNDSVFKKWRDELGTDRKTTLDIVEPKSSYTSTSSPRPSEKKCPHCGGKMVSEELMNEKKDACYYKVKSRYKVWPSAYASGALVKCRKVGAKNWGKKSKVKESQQPVKTKARAMYGKGLQNLLDQWVLKSTQRDTALYMGQNKKAIALSNEIKQIKQEIFAMDGGKEAFDQLLVWIKAKNESK